MPAPVLGCCRVIVAGARPRAVRRPVNEFAVAAVCCCVPLQSTHARKLAALCREAWPQPFVPTPDSLAPRLARRGRTPLNVCILHVHHSSAERFTNSPAPRRAPPARSGLQAAQRVHQAPGIANPRARGQSSRQCPTATASRVRLGKHGSAPERTAVSMDCNRPAAPAPHLGTRNRGGKRTPWPANASSSGRSQRVAQQST